MKQSAWLKLFIEPFRNSFMNQLAQLLRRL